MKALQLSVLAFVLVLRQLTARFQQVGRVEFPKMPVIQSAGNDPSHESCTAFSSFVECPRVVQPVVNPVVSCSFSVLQGEPQACALWYGPEVSGFLVVLLVFLVVHRA